MMESLRVTPGLGWNLNLAASAFAIEWAYLAAQKQIRVASTSVWFYALKHHVMRAVYNI